MLCGHTEEWRASKRILRDVCNKTDHAHTHKSHREKRLAKKHNDTRVSKRTEKKIVKQEYVCRKWHYVYSISWKLAWRYYECTCHNLTSQHSLSTAGVPKNAACHKKSHHQVHKTWDHLRFLWICFVLSQWSIPFASWAKRQFLRIIHSTRGKKCDYNACNFC